jgi:pilus assembly protein CpaF
MRDLFGFERSGVRDGRSVGHFYGTGRRPRFLERLRASGVEVPEGLFDRRMLADAVAEEDEACVH